MLAMIQSNGVSGSACADTARPFKVNATIGISPDLWIVFSASAGPVAETLNARPILRQYCETAPHIGGEPLRLCLRQRLLSSAKCRAGSDAGLLTRTLKARLIPTAAKR